MANTTNTKRIEVLEERMDELNGKLDLILNAINGNGNIKSNGKSRGTSTSTKKTSKDDYVVVASAKDNRQKVYKAMEKDGKTYDRNTYKKYAKKLGVWSDTYNRVVGTYK